MADTVNPETPLTATTVRDPSDCETPNTTSMPGVVIRCYGRFKRSGLDRWCAPCLRAEIRRLAACPPPAEPEQFDERRSPDGDGPGGEQHSSLQQPNGAQVPGAGSEPADAHTSPPPAEQEEKLFPIGDGPSIPWRVIEPFRAQAKKQHYQTLERLAERGGLSVAEALSVLEGGGDFDKYWAGKDTKNITAHILRLQALVRERQALSSPPPAEARGYSIDAKEDGTWLIIRGQQASAMIRLEAVVPDLGVSGRAVAELRAKLLLAPGRAPGRPEEP